MELQKLDKLIYEKIPSGFHIREKAHKYADELSLEELHCGKYVMIDKAERSLGTLGGGNHFIEVDQDEEGALYLVIHSGSRYLGLEVAEYYQEKGFHELNSPSKEELEALEQELGSKKELKKSIRALKREKKTDIPKLLAYVSGDLFHRYLHDMKIVQQFALQNRQAMVHEIVKGMKLHVVDQFTCVHNYIDTDNRILRKVLYQRKKANVF